MLLTGYRHEQLSRVRGRTFVVLMPVVSRVMVTHHRGQSGASAFPRVTREILAVSADCKLDVPFRTYTQRPPASRERPIVAGLPSLVDLTISFGVFSLCAPELRFRGALGAMSVWMTGKPFAAIVSSATAIRSRGR